MPATTRRDDDAVSRNQPETVVNQELRQLCSPCSGIVLYAVARFQQFRRVGMRQNALVVSSRKEERAESQQQVHAKDYKAVR